MNLRTTTFLFALLLATLWVFGLMVQYKRGAGEESALSPSFSAIDAGKFNDIVIEKNKEKDTSKVEFKESGDNWYQVADGKKARVEAFRIRANIIDQLKNARHDETILDTNKSLKTLGLDPPQMTIKIQGEYKN